ncbi:ribose-phosphate pyrophosphokinase, partial [Butyricicoccus sp. 1XD8-22]
IENSPIKELIVTNTIQLPDEKRSPKVKQLSVANLMAEAISRVYENKSVSTLFD